MATKAQTIANKRNAQQSTGPRTPEGKATVSQNAIKHGLTGKKPLIPGEEQTDFNLYHYEMFEELAPIGPMETMLAERIISLSWRLERTVRIQNETMHAMLTPKPLSGLDKLRNSLSSDNADGFKSDVDQASKLGRSIIKDFSNARVLDRVLMYERRIENSLYKTRRELQKLKLTRKFGPHAAPHTTCRGVALAKTENTPQPTCRGVALAKTDIPPQPAIKMQNKPNLQTPKSDLTSYAHMDYDHNPPVPDTPRQTQSNATKPNLTPKTNPQNPCLASASAPVTLGRS